MDELLRRILRLLDDRAVLSLDVFDTALLRTLRHPGDLFALIEAHHRHLNAAAPPFNFTAERVAAEQRVRAHVLSTESRGDIVLDEIYSGMSLPSDWDREALRKIEIAAERAVCRPNPLVRTLVERARSRGKRIVFISDMYLPQVEIAHLLKANGYGDVDRLYVSSSEGGESKHTGALFRRMLAREKVNAADVLHIGDNLWSDVVMPLRNGMAALMCPMDEESPGRNHELPGTTSIASVCYGLVRAHFAFENRDIFYRIGYARMGLPWLYFARSANDVGKAAGEGTFAECIVQLLTATTNAGAAVRRGAEAFADDFTRLQSFFPWLSVTHAIAAHSITALRDSPSAAEFDAIRNYDPRLQSARARRRNWSAR